MRGIAIAAAILALVLTTGCEVTHWGGTVSFSSNGDVAFATPVVVEPAPIFVTPGPPPYAPAHGYRHRYHDYDMRYDSNLGCYVVLGMPNVYFSNGVYLRFSGDRWTSAIGVGGPWRIAGSAEIPVLLYKAKGPKRSHRWKHPKTRRGGPPDRDRGRGHGRDRGR